MEHHDPFDIMKRHAKRLVKQAQDGTLPEKLRKQFLALPDLDEARLQTDVKHRHGLSVTARYLGFKGWSHVVHVIEGKDDSDFGTILYGAPGASYPNIWEAHCEQARKIRDDHGGTLLPYKNQFIIVEDGYLTAHSIPADLPEWALMGRDWTRPNDLEARTRLYGRRIAAALS